MTFLKEDSGFEIKYTGPAGALPASTPPLEGFQQFVSLNSFILVKALSLSFII